MRREELVGRGGRSPRTVGRWILPSLPASAARARRLVRGLLEASGEPGTDVDTAVLIASELVANAIVHGAPSAVELTVEVEGAGVRVEVADGSPRPPAQAEPAPADEHGRGLLIVDRSSTAWGWSGGGIGHGKRVWCDLPADE